jgi:hypothetical protein
LDLDPKRVAEAVAAVTRTAAEDAMAAMLGARERFEGARAVIRSREELCVRCTRRSWKMCHPVFLVRGRERGTTTRRLNAHTKLVLRASIRCLRGMR